MSARFCIASGSCFRTSLSSVSVETESSPYVLDIDVTDEELAISVIYGIEFSFVSAVAHAAESAELPAPRVKCDCLTPRRPR